MTMAMTMDARLAPTPFTKVPLEVLLRITSHLSTTEFGNLRRTCRSLESSLLNSFTKEWFSKRQFMLTEDSLQALLDILRSRLGCCLTTVAIGHDSYDINGTGWFAGGWDEQTDAYARGLDDQRAFLLTGRVIHALAECFRLLDPSVIIRIQDYASTRRSRDGPGAMWNSYGATTVFRRTGMRLWVFDRDHRHGRQYWASQVFTYVMAALAQAEARPEHIEVDDRFGGQLLAWAFIIPRSMRPALLPLIKNIRTLHLTLCFQDARGGLPSRVVEVEGANGTSRKEGCPDLLLRQFLLHAQALKHLRLNFDNRSPVSRALLQWLALPAADDPDLSMTEDGEARMSHPPPAPSFPELEELDLGKVKLPSDLLIQLVVKFAPTLRKLALWRVTLQSLHAQSGDGGHGNDVDADKKPPPNMWAQFFKKLRREPDVNFRQLFMGQLAQQSRQALAPVAVCFNAGQGGSGGSGGRERVDERQPGSAVHYTGNDWRQFISEVENAMEVILPRRAPSADESESSDTDSEMEDDDDDEAIDQDETGE